MKKSSLKADGWKPEQKISFHLIVGVNPSFNIKVCNFWPVTVKWSYKSSKRLSLRNCVRPEVCNLFSWKQPMYCLWHFVCIITYTPHPSPKEQDYTNTDYYPSLLPLQISDTGVRTLNSLQKVLTQYLLWSQITVKFTFFSYPWNFH